MTSNHTTAITGRPAIFARVTAFVLLLLITISAVAAAAHNHGNVTTQRRSFATDTATGDKEDSRTSSKKQANGGECLVCQFHQHLNSGLLGALPHASLPVAQLTFAVQNQYRVTSHTYAPQRGRAPPINSLA